MRKSIGVLWMGVFCMLAVVTEGINKLSFHIADKGWHIYKIIDKDNAFAHITVHHIIQGALALFLIGLLARFMKLELKYFGLTKINMAKSVKWGLRFGLAWFLIQILGGLIILLNTDEGVALHLPLTVKNYAAYLSFQLFLSGPSEELLYRALCIPLLMYIGEKAGFGKSYNAILAIGATCIYFIIGHISYSIIPFAIVNFNILQILTVLIAGICYGLILVKTKNVFGCMLAHSLLNIVVISTSIGFYLIFR